MHLLFQNRLIYYCQILQDLIHINVIKMAENIENIHCFCTVNFAAFIITANII